VEQYAYYDGAGPHNEGTRDAVLQVAWCNNGCLHDEESYRDHPEISWRSSPAVGTTWSSGGSERGTGVLVLNLGRTKRIGIFSVFQMRSDGRTTGIRLSYHPVTGDPEIDKVCPIWNSEKEDDWVKLGDWVELGSGEDVYSEEDSSEERQSMVKTTDIWQVPGFYTRFLKIECRNDGRHGSPSYIELRQIKAFENGICDLKTICFHYIQRNSTKISKTDPDKVPYDIRQVLPEEIFLDRWDRCLLC